MNRQQRRAQARTARREDGTVGGHGLACGCAGYGRFVGVGVCGACGGEDAREFVMPTSASVGEPRSVCWSPCGLCGVADEVWADVVCVEVTES